MRFFATLVLSGLMTVRAGAESFELKVFGHQVLVSSSPIDGDILKIDGRNVHKNQNINFSEMTTIDGVSLLIGDSANGGNSCDGAPFIISFPAGANPRIDGPIESCNVTTMVALPHRLEFITAAQPGTDGQKWLWNPADGFKQVAGATFVASQGKGWAQLRERTASHPSDLLAYKEIAEQIADSPILTGKTSQRLSAVSGAAVLMETYS